MKFHSTTKDVIRTGVTDRNAFTIKASGKAFEILSKGLYSDRILAIVRELSTNAWDAHLDAGTEDTPFTIHLPNCLKPHFSIRDFGTGLSHEDVMTLYTTYFESTKDESNLFVGALGLGSKSPFSYAESFTVTSYYKGEKKSYAAFVGEEGVPEIALLDTSETNEANGLEISLPVKEQDFWSFETKARLILKRFDPVPTVKGSPDFEVDPIEYSLKGTNWGLIKGAGRGHAVAIQGKIAYPLKTDAMRDDLTKDQINLIQYVPIEIHFEMGELDIAADREALGYDKRTIENILAKVDTVLEEIKKEINSKFAACKTLWEAKALYGELYNGSQYDNPLANLMQNATFEVVWKGETIRDSIFSLDLKADFPGTTVYGFNVAGQKSVGTKIKHRRYSQNTNNSTVYLNPNKSDTFILFYNDIGNGAVARVDHFLDQDDNYGKTAFVFKTETKAEFTCIKKEIQGAPIRNVSDLPKAPKRAKTGGSSGRGIGNGYIWTGAGNSWRSPTRDNWDKRSIQLSTGGIYVVIHNFEVLGGDSDDRKLDMSTFKEIIKNAKILGLIKDDQEIYAFPKGHSKRVIAASNWINFFKYLEDGLKTLIKTKGTQQNSADAEAWEKFTGSRASYYRIGEKISDLDEISSKLINRHSSVILFSVAVTAMRDSGANAGNKIRKLARQLGVDLDKAAPQFDLEKLYEEMIVAYPLMSILIDKLGISGVRHNVADYINMVDEKSVDKKVVA